MARSNDTTVTKIDSSSSPTGPDGDVYLASGKSLAMRMWRDEAPSDVKAASRREYETVGYVLDGKAELHIEGQMVLLEPGDSWVVPTGAEHPYKILEGFSAKQVKSIFLRRMRGVREQDGVVICEESLRLLKGDPMLLLIQPGLGRVPVEAQCIHIGTCVFGRYINNTPGLVGLTTV